MAGLQPPSKTVKTRFLIISDTHTAPLVDSSQNERARDRAFRAPLPAADVLLHCGDITMMGHLDEYEAALDMLGAIDAPLKLVIAGNHDLSLDEEFYLGQSRGVPSAFTNGQRMHRKKYDPDMPRKAKEMWKGEKAKAKGVTYLDEGTHHFVLQNGARLNVYASPWQPEFFQWGFNYDHDNDRWNPPHLSAPDAVNVAVNPLPEHCQPGEIDVVMTHGPPKNRLDLTSSRLAVGCPHMLRAIERTRPRLHAWGHIHEAWGVERVEWPADRGSKTDAGIDQLVKKAEKYAFAGADLIKDRAAFVDVSGGADAPLRLAEETVMVNASIMDLSYTPSNAPVVVDLDLEYNKA
ncbi:ser thr protein phosphatase family protein [Diplodia corticola]|uniref:Ser thr protein phosphatase family protein n=1 Tax=Diplodia corticola TaxID=236234 RepID=A0A1J9S7H3_9PEZI|nr:ser thr protein phosphatase family protein [Diplodia corticola]OJD35868.1 ser thr protein phosphatase family protein [Diplodia corticola]